PNVAPTLLVQFSLTVASAIVLESGLSFLGLGVVPPEPSWGLMIRGARSTMEQAPWLLLWPCLALTGTVIALNLLCDRLRDVLDPRARGRQASWLVRSAVRVLPGVAGSTQQSSLLRVEGLTIEIATPSGARFRPVRDVALTVGPGETLAIVGESGSGKTLTALPLLGLLPPAARIIDGTVLFAGRARGVRVLNLLPEDALRQLRGDEIAMVFQDPGNSLNPVHRICHQLAETIRAHRPANRSAVAVQAIRVLREVGLPDAERRAHAFPHELSGGQLSRPPIAMAIADRPRPLLSHQPATSPH